MQVKQGEKTVMEYPIKNLQHKQQTNNVVIHMDDK